MSFAEVNPPEVSLSAERYAALLKQERNAQAAEAGFDMNNPVSKLVLDSHWKEGMSVADLSAFKDQYKVGVPVVTEGEAEDNVVIPPAPEGKVTEITGTVGEGAGSGQSLLSGGSSVSGQITTPDPSIVAVKTYEAAMKQGGSREDAMAAALEATIKTAGQKAVLDRRRGRQVEEENAQAIIAGLEASHGQGD